MMHRLNDKRVYLNIGLHVRCEYDVFRVSNQLAIDKYLSRAAGSIVDELLYTAPSQENFSHLICSFSFIIKLLGHNEI